MNKTYRLIWNDFTHTWVAVAEIAKARGKRASGAVLLAAAGFIAVPPAPTFAAPPNPPAASQLPTGGQLVAGQATIASRVNNTLTITQSSNRAAIDWQTFNVGSAAQVNFIQPSSSAAILNRVLDPNPSQIFGRITANGQVFLTNSSGIYFSPTANVNVGALTATTHSISNDDFMAGRLNFTRNGATGKVENEGSLTADLKGYIALLAPEVRNSGVIVAQLGTVALAAGEAFELQFDNNRLTNIRVEPATIAALVENGNAVLAPGGLIILSAQAANRLQGGVVNNSGSLEATGLVDNGGVIRLEASDRIVHSGSIKVDAAANSAGKGGTATLIASLANPDSTTDINGSISARGGDLPPIQGEGRGGDGGFIETSGARVNIGADTRVDTRAPHGKTGTWLLDPDGFTIASSGGDISGATLSTNLGTADVSITSASGSHDGTSGNINVNDTVAWSAHLLTLSATNNININANMNATGSASLALVFGQGAVASGNTSNIITGSNAAVNLPAGTSNFTTLQGSDGVLKNYAVITSLGAPGSTTTTDLQGMIGNRALNYALGGSIDASATSAWNAGAGFVPVGDGTTFTGTFDGLGHTISGLTVNRPSTNWVGLFGYSNSNAEVHNLSMLNVNMIGQDRVAAVMAQLNGGIISNVYATGTVSGRNEVGGLVGLIAWNVPLTESHSSVTVSGSGTNIGGLVGQIVSNVSAIQDSYATGSVTGGGSSQNVGGLVGGINGGGLITKSYATGAVTGVDSVGGLVGTNLGGGISNSYATGNVTGTNAAGGLLGTHIGGTGEFGMGRTGSAGSNATVSNSYATGSVTGSSYVGGLIGKNVGGQGGDARANFMDRTILSTGGTGGTAIVSTSYATGTVTGSSNSGGLIGGDEPGIAGRRSFDTSTPGAGGTTRVSTSYWNTQTSGQSSSATGTGITSAQMHQQASFTDWDIANTGGSGSIWRIYEGHTTPLLTSFLTPLTLTGAPDASATYSGSAQSGGTTSLTVDGTLLKGAPATGTSAGFYNGYYSTQQGYDLIGGSLTIGKANATVTANSDLTKTYSGVSQSVSGFTASGLVNGELATVLSGVTAGASGTNAGSHTSTASGTDSNYNLTLVNGALTIAKANATVTANSDLTKTYSGVSQSVSGFTASGLVNGELATALTGVTASGSGTNAGSYTVAASGTDSNYNLTLVNGTLTIDKAHLTVTADPQSRLYGAANPTLSTTVSGFVNDQNLSSSGVSGAGSATTTAVPTTNVGTATISAAAGTLAASNYDFSNLVAGTLTIDKAHLTVTADPQSRLYGAANPVLTTTVSGFVNDQNLGTSGVSGAGSATTTAVPTTNVGTAAISAAAGTLTAGNYDFTTLTAGTLTIAKAHLTVTADPQSRLYGAANPTLSTTVSGFVNDQNLSTSGVTGAGSATTTAVPTSNVGTATITAAAGTLTASNYDFSKLVSGTLTIAVDTAAVAAAQAAVDAAAANAKAAAAAATASSTAGSVTGETSAGMSPFSPTPDTSGGGGVSVSLVREPSAQQSGIITVSVPKEMATAGSSFSFSFPAQLAAAAADTSDAVSVTTLGGAALPAWLRFNPESKSFTASTVPEGAFPIHVTVTIGRNISNIVISHLTE